MISRKEFLVYQYDAKNYKNNISLKDDCNDVKWTIAHPESIRRFFSNNPDRLKTFLAFYEKGYQGIILYHNEEYVSYSWMSTPRSPGPHHLPKWVRGLGSYWIFYGRTNEKYGRRGFIKLALKLLIKTAYEEESEPRIYVDIASDNFRSRKAALAFGFKPMGKIEFYNLKLPRFKKPFFGKWDRSEEHPRLDCEVQSGTRKKPSLKNRAPSPLLLEGWQEFNRIRWGVNVFRVKFKAGGSELPLLDACLYHDKRGRILLPSRNPYAGLAFTPTPKASIYRMNRQWADVAEQLLYEMQSRGLINGFIMPPEVADVRLWQWAGFKVGVKYTYYIDFPYDISQAVYSVRSNIKKASKRGYRCDRTDNFNDVIKCLAATEVRKGFDYRLSVQDLKIARDLMGDETFRTYVCYAPDGEPACAQVWLHSPGTRAICWMTGGKREHLSSGVNQLTTNYIVDDLQKSEAIGFDYCGANIPSVAAAKAKFGCRLTPYYYIEPNGFKQVVSSAINWLRSFGST